MLLLLVHFFIIASANGVITTDQVALLAIKSHIIHDPSSFLVRNWNQTTPVCNWTGVTCDTYQHRVTALNITRLFFRGTIPSQLGNLSSLQALDLSYNRLFGPIPSSIFGIQALQILDLSNNQLSGSFPSSTRNTSSLQIIDFGNNILSDQLPPNVFTYLPSLEELYLTGNLFHGEIPSALSNCKHLRLLVLPLNDFSGAIPKEIGNLTKLQGLYLVSNKFQGEIPQEVGNLAELQFLWLHNNLLTGSIPFSLFNLSSLSEISLSNNSLTGSLRNDMCRGLPLLNKFYISKNQITGPIPQILWQCKQLMHVSLPYNHFTGRIPSDIGNLTRLTILSLTNNNLTGEIPHEIGNLRNLERLELDLNRLVGVIPPTIFNMSTLRLLGVTDNMLSGNLPSRIDIELPSFENLHLAGNNFSGTIPSFIFNASKLSILDLADNSFSGSIPNTFNNLRSLQKLLLSFNSFKSPTSELNFFSSLSNCKNLSLITLSGNPLRGILPSSIGNLSNSLEKIYLRNCNISGNIPKEISSLTNLILLQLQSNKLDGSIPITFGRLVNLQGLSLSNNKLEGPIPEDLCHLTGLVEFFLNDNKLSGSIPPCLGNLATLRRISLSSNELTSVIPSTFGNLKDILEFNLSSNSLNGPLPLEFGNFKIALQIDLSWNNLSGDIPTTFGGLTSLEFLSLGYNRLQGSIPESLGDLISLKYLNLSNNNLSGIIPFSLEKLLNLKDLNLSFNKLEGEIPKGGSFANFSAASFTGNDLLCGSPNLHVRPCKSNKTSTHGKSRKIARLLGIVLPLSIAFVIVITLGLRFVLISRRQKRAVELPNDANKSPQATRRRFSYLELLRATDGFSESMLIGRGGFGSVYKARLNDAMEVAVKVFHLQFERAWKSFDVECEVLKNIRHRNLVKIISSCSNEDFKALVLEYMPNGSLEKCLYSNYNLDIFQRLNIMIDVASALEYLHFGHSTPIIHCDLKPGNVLLDDNMIAHVGDFGIAKLLTGEDQSMAITQTLATFGYMAPEYGREGQVSTKGDVYSYGIMLMETFTKKNPTDEIFTGEMTLKRWVNDMLSISVVEVVDANLLNREDEHFATKEQCISSILNLAMECTNELPERRISTKEIVTRLLKVRVALLVDIDRSTRRDQV